MTLQKILRPIVIFLLFLIPIFPLIVANSYFFPFITGKAFYFRILVELIFAGWIILAFLDARYRPKLAPLTIAVSLFAFVTLVADLIGVNPLRSIWSNFERMEGWLTIIHLWAFFIVASSIFGSGEDGRRLWHRWLNVSLGVAVIIGIYGMLQLFGQAAIHQGSSRLDASLGNAEYMAIYMLFHVFIASYLFFVARTRTIVNYKFLQWIYPFLAVFFSFLLFETQTRGTILGLIGGIMLALALYALFGKGEPKKWRITSAGIICVIVIIGVVFWLNRSAPFIQNSPVLNRMATISWKDTTTQARAYIWPMALKGAEQRPIFGWGQENFNYLFNTNYDPHMWAQEQWFDRAHDVYLDWLTASGIIGLIAYLALYVLFLTAVWKSSMTMAEKSVLTGLLAAYAVHNVFVFDNLASYVLFFAALGFGNSLHEGRVIRRLGTEPVRLDAVEYIVAPVAIVVLVAVLYFIDVRPIQANTRLITALGGCGSGKADPASFQNALAVNAYVANQEIREQLLGCAGNVIQGQSPNPTKQAFFALSAKEIQAQIAATPKDARIYVLGGSFLNSVNQVPQAQPILEKAHQLTPGKQFVNFQLATDYMAAGETDKALALLKQAYDEDPTYGEAQSAYAVGLIIAGKEAQARTIFNNNPAIFDTARVAQVYASLKQYQKSISIYQKLVAQDPSNVQLRVQLAQIQYSAGMISQAVQTMRDIEKDHPELKTQIEATIKQIQP